MRLAFLAAFAVPKSQSIEPTDVRRVLAAVLTWGIGVIPDACATRRPLGAKGVSEIAQAILRRKLADSALQSVLERDFWRRTEAQSDRDRRRPSPRQRRHRCPIWPVRLVRIAVARLLESLFVQPAPLSLDLRGATLGRLVQPAHQPTWDCVLRGFAAGSDGACSVAAPSRSRSGRTIRTPSGYVPIGPGQRSSDSPAAAAIRPPSPEAHR